MGAQKKEEDYFPKPRKQASTFRYNHIHKHTTEIQHDTHTKRMHTYQTAEPAVNWLPLPQTAASSYPSPVDDKQDDMMEKEKGKKREPVR